MNLFTEIVTVVNVVLFKSFLTGSIYVVLHEDSNSFDHLQSCFQACVLDYVIRTRPSTRKVNNSE